MKQKYDDGIFLYDQEKYSEALKCFQEILDDPSIHDQAPYPYVLFCKGRTLGKLRRYEEAIDDFKRAYAAFNANAEGSNINVANTLRNIGFAHAMLDQRELAYKSLNKAIELAPEFGLLYNTKGYIDNMFHKYDDAIKSFIQAINLQPNSGLAWCNMGYAHCSLADKLRSIPADHRKSEDKYKEAIRCFDMAIGIDKVRYYKEAIECFNKKSIGTVRGLSSYEWNYKGYALLFGFKKYREAIYNFDKAIELDPNFGLAWFNKGFALTLEGFALPSEGNLLESSKKYVEALKCFDNAIDAYRMKAQDEIGDLAKNIDNLLEGKDVLLECLEKTDNPTKKEFQIILINLAYALAGKGVSLDSLGDKAESYSEAIRCFDTVIKILKALEGVGMFKEDLPEGMAANLAVVYYHKGYTFAKTREYKLAVDCFDEAIKYYDEGQRKDRAKLQRSSEKVRDKANILRNEAFAYDKLGNHDTASKLYQDAINEDDKFYLPWNSKGYHILYFMILEKHEEDKYDEAIKCFDTAIKLAKEQREDFANAWYNKGVALYCEGESWDEHRSASSKKSENNYEEAIKCFDMATKINDKYADAWYFKGITLFRLKRYDEATRSYDDAIERNHEHAYAWYSKGINLYRLGRYGDATDCFGKAIEIYEAGGNKEDANLARFLIYKGVAFASLKRYNEAIECFNEGIAMLRHKCPLSDQAYLSRGESMYELEKYAEALKDFDEVEDSGNIGKKYNNIGLCHYQLGMNEQAKNDFCKSTQPDRKEKKEEKEKAAAYYNLAVLYNEEDNPDQAKRNLEICHNLNPNFPNAKGLLKKFDRPHKTEWYNWWFTHGRGQKALGLLLIVSVIIPVLIIALVVDYFVNHLALHTTMHTGLTSLIKVNATAIITGLTVLIGISIGVLLLPSLTRIKAGVIEFDIASTDTDTKNIDLTPIRDPTQMDLGKLPIQFEMQSFTRPLNFQMQELTMPISSQFQDWS